MKRRDFITLVGGASLWSVGASAQQPQAKRRIGVLSGLASQDPESNARHIALRKAVADLGWTEDRNIAIDFRSTEGDINRERAIAAELVALARRDSILSEGSRSIGSLLRATRTIPIVFVNVVDPVGSGVVASLSRPPLSQLRRGRGLISYGPSSIEPTGRAAGYIDRILKG